MRAARDVRRRYYPAARALALVGMVGLVCLALVTVADVLARWLFNTPVYGLENIVELAVPVILASCFPIGLLQGQNIAIRFLGKALGQPGENWLEILAVLATLVFFGLLAWQVAVYAGELTADGRVTEIIRVPMAPSWWVAAAVLAVCVPVQVLVLRARLRSIRGRPYEDIRAETVADVVEREGLGGRSRD